MPKITIVSTVSNKRRAGVFFNGGANVFEADHFTAEQLKQIAEDPMLTIVAGMPVTAGQVDEFMEAVAARKADDLAVLAEAEAAASAKPAKGAGK
jgi:hypothetical protein